MAPTFPSFSLDRIDELPEGLLTRNMGIPCDIRFDSGHLSLSSFGQYSEREHAVASLKMAPNLTENAMRKKTNVIFHVRLQRLTGWNDELR